MLRANVVDCYQVPELFIMDSPIPTSPTHISVNKSLLKYYILSVPLLPLEDLINKFFDHFWKIFSYYFIKYCFCPFPLIFFWNSNYMR